MPFELNTNIIAAPRGLEINPFAIQQAAQQRHDQEVYRQTLEEQRQGQIEQRQLAIEKAQRDAAESQALRGLFSGEQMPSEQQIYGVVGPQRGFEIVKGLRALQTQDVKDYGELQKVVGSTLGGSVQHDPAKLCAARLAEGRSDS
jgi:hypothetical protein